MITRTVHSIPGTRTMRPAGSPYVRTTPTYSRPAHTGFFGHPSFSSWTHRPLFPAARPVFTTHYPTTYTTTYPRPIHHNSESAAVAGLIIGAAALTALALL